MVKCSKCAGKGRHQDYCMSCNGKGWVLKYSTGRDTKDCGQCKGSGMTLQACNTCNGSGQG